MVGRRSATARAALVSLVVAVVALGAGDLPGLGRAGLRQRVLSPVAADDGVGGGSGQIPFSITLRTDALRNTVPTGTPFSLVVDASGGTPPYTFAVDRFLPVGPVRGPSYTFLVAGVDRLGDSLLCPGDLTYQARAADSVGELASSQPMTITVTSRLDFALELDERLSMLDDPLLRLVRPNLYGAHPPYTLTWEFDDGSAPVTRPGRQRHDNGVLHRFPASGGYHVRVSVVDGCNPPQHGAVTELLRVSGSP